MRPEHAHLKTSRKNESCTTMIETYKLDPRYAAGEIYIADTAGLGENRGPEIDIANTNSLQAVLSKSLEVNLVFFIHDRNWGDRGNSIR